MHTEDESAREQALSHETLIHDFNNVFETITEAADLLKSDRRWRDLAATLVRSVARGRMLLGAIPDRSTTLAAVVADAMQSITDYCTAARRPRVQVVVDVPASICLPGTAKDWDRVFSNLFLNTVQILRRPGRIDVVARESQGSLTVTVSDDGPGIPTGILQNLFQPDVSTKPDGRGGARTGLGLHIVSSIVEKHAGSVSARNKDERGGAVFTIQLPSLR